MATGKKSALVVCPGRGSYTRSELGYFHRNHSNKQELLSDLDAWRERAGQPTISELDSANRYSLDTYTRGNNASLLTFACSFADFKSIVLDEVEVVAITGNSMGWYTALACGGAMELEDSINLVNTMGTLTHQQQSGGQIMFPVTDDDWQADHAKSGALRVAVSEIQSREGCELYRSIVLGGIEVFAGNDVAVEALAKEGPQGPSRFPVRLENHGAYHSPLMREISVKARESLARQCSFRSPRVPLIDGCGRIWRPKAKAADFMLDYTLGRQIVDTYDFAAAIRVGLCEFAPDWIIVLGPGDSLGGAIGQTLCALRWRGIDSKKKFLEVQGNDPIVISLGREEQRVLAA